MFEGHDLHDVTYLTPALNELSDLRLLENFLTVIKHSKTTNYLQIICRHTQISQASGLNSTNNSAASRMET